MYDYLNTLKELEQKGTNYLIKLTLLHEICCFNVDGASDDYIDMLYEFYTQGYWNCEHEFICELYDYCDDNNKSMRELSYEELYEYFKGDF